MVNWNSRAIKKGMVIPLNLRVTRVTERDGFRIIHLEVSPNDLPPGFEGKDLKIRVVASTQDLTLAEANGE